MKDSSLLLLVAFVLILLALFVLGKGGGGGGIGTFKLTLKGGVGGGGGGGGGKIGAEVIIGGGGLEGMILLICGILDVALGNALVDKRDGTFEDDTGDALRRFGGNGTRI